MKPRSLMPLSFIALLLCVVLLSHSVRSEDATPDNATAVNTTENDSSQDSPGQAIQDIVPQDDGSIEVPQNDGDSIVEDNSTESIDLGDGNSSSDNTLIEDNSTSESPQSEGEESNAPDNSTSDTIRGGEDGSKDALTSYCTMTIGTYNPGRGTDARVVVHCAASNQPNEIDFHLVADAGGDCEYELPSSPYHTACTEVMGIWSCVYDVDINLPTFLSTAQGSSCYNSPDALAPRDLCEKVHVTGTGIDTYEYGRCSHVWNTDYFTYEVPKLRSEAFDAEQNQPIPVTIDANAYYNIDRIEIDMDCTKYGDTCVDSQFNADVVINSFDLPNSHQIQDYYRQITFTNQACIGNPYGCGVSMRVYDTQGHYRFDSGFSVVVYRHVQSNCDNLGGDCCPTGTGCAGSAIGGSDCPSTCCDEPCKPYCSQIGEYCQPGQQCTGSYHDSMEGPQCCDGGCIDQPPQQCASYPNNPMCCPAGQVCVGGGYPQSNAQGCGTGTCFLDCASHQCTTEASVCSSLTLTCGSSNTGSQVCAGYSTVCGCDGTTWKPLQVCESGCMDTLGFIGDQPGFADSVKQGGSRSIESAWCTMPGSLAGCQDSGQGFDGALYTEKCLDIQGTHDDTAAGANAVKEYFCDTSLICQSTTVPCPNNGIPAGGKCILGDCPVKDLGPNTNVFCQLKYNSFGLLDKRRSGKSPLIQVCDPTILNYLKTTVLTDQITAAQVAAGEFDNGMLAIFQKLLQRYSQQSIPNAADKCEGADLSPSILLTTNKGGVCTEWSSTIYSLARTAGVPASRLYLANYFYRPQAGMPKATLMGGHEVVMYMKDDLHTWQVIDLTWAHAMFDASSWSTQPSFCNGARGLFQNDKEIHEDWPPNAFNNACAPGIPYAGEVCPDGTALETCSLTQPFYCNNKAQLSVLPKGKKETDLTPYNCGCPNIAGVSMVDLPDGTGYCKCSNPDQCLSNPENLPYYCAPTTGSSGILVIQCDKCHTCPTGTKCSAEGNWCEPLPR